MTEQEYVIVTNRVKISAAIRLLRDVLPGDAYLVSEEDLNRIIANLCKVEEQLFGSTARIICS